MNGIKKIDIHAHATAFQQFAPPAPRWPQTFLTGEQLVNLYDQLEIEMGVLLPIMSPEAQRTTMTNENCKYISDQYPDRLLWFCNVDPRAGDNTPDADLSYLMNHYKSLGAKGVGEVTAQLYADDPKMDNMFGHAAACGLPVMIHIAPHFDGCYGMVDELGLPRIEKMLAKHPDLKLIGHSQPFWAEISGTVTEEIRNIYPEGKVTEGRLHDLLRHYPNLYCDLSAGSGANALMRDPEHAAAFLEEFSDRICYGCDVCDISNTHQFRLNRFLDELVESGKLSLTNYRKIVRENAEKLLGL